GPDGSSEPYVLGRRPAHPGLRLPDLPAARGGDHVRAVEDAAAAGAAQPDRPGAADAADAADDGLFVPADDRVLRAAGARRPGALLVCRQLRQYHSAKLRGRVGKRAAEAG